MEISGDSSLNILIPLFENKELAIRVLKSAIDFKNLQLSYNVNIIVSDDSKDRHLEIFLKNIDLFKNECVFISREKKINEVNSAVHNWNFLLNYSYKLNDTSHYMLLHHDEEICLNYSSELSLSSELIILPLTGIARRRNNSLGRLLFKYFIVHHPKLLYCFNIIGPCGCFISNQKMFFNTNLRWLVDVDFYFRTIFKLINTNKSITLNSNFSIKTHVNDSSITSKINVSKILIKETRKIKIGQPYFFINYLQSIIKNINL